MSWQRVCLRRAYGFGPIPLLNARIYGGLESLYKDPTIPLPVWGISLQQDKSILQCP
ncbi:hypothetical protein TWF192_004293 [Orbilia oligospora]|uniref:Uncharacterized protein n=1 Tax=Orbilia oligospora TaxID=2813651 RepID=A0A6G1MDP7_ORBOL|nr:hypothetical protein TWF191_002729 [Orbilia oligospora]KAF3253008.1 hypothetical protein TWF192_004293 [Orbilia oligospora]